MHQPFRACLTILDDTGRAPFLSCSAGSHGLVNRCIPFSKANMHPKLPVIWILKSSAVNQTVLKLSSIHEFWCLVLLSAAQHCALQACSVWWRGACASLSTDNSLSTTAWLSLRVNLLSSSTQPNPELLVRIWASRAILQVLSAGEPVPSAGLSAPLSYSLFLSFQWH